MFPSMLRAEPLTRDAALLALNDHLGREVEVLVQAKVPPTSHYKPVVMRAQAPLRRWHDDRLPAEALARDDIAGRYDVGGASFDVTDFEGAQLLGVDDDPPYGLTFQLADGVTLSVAWGVERASD
jgi:hypothetical protein